MGDRGLLPRALVWAGIAILGLAGSLGSGCEVVVGDSIPPFGCVGDANTCPVDEVCSPVTMTCVPQGSTCIGTPCPGGSTCSASTLHCESTDGGGGTFDGDTTLDGNGADDAPSVVDDSSASDSGPRTDSSADGAGPNTDDDDDGATTADATLDAPLDAPTDAATESAADATLNDASVLDATGPSDAEAGSDGSGACSALFCRCSGASDCASGVCADQSTVTSGLYTQAGNANFCTTPCCSSSDCGPMAVCFGTGAGGNYCVEPAWLSRSTTLGSLAGGATCTGSADCRSGLCTAGACVDTCCSTQDAGSVCAPGATCNLGTFPGAGTLDTHRTGFCNANAAACGFSPCTACRTSSDCSVIGAVCSYAAAAVGNTDIVATCEPAATGAGVQGSACATGSACASGYCDPNSQQCTDVCFTNADCKAGWRCRTELVPIQSGGGNYNILRCGS